MSISTPTFSSGPRQQHHYRPTHSKYHESNGIRSRIPPLQPPSGPCPSTSGELYNNRLPNPHWTNSDRTTYPGPPLIMHPNQNEQQQQILTSQLFQKHQLIPVLLFEYRVKYRKKYFPLQIDTLLKEPNRSQRPPQIIIFLRGLPGSYISFIFY